MPFSTRNKTQDFEAEALPHLNDLFRTAIRLTVNKAEAEDLVQEVYLQAWRSFDRFELGTNCRAWLFKILMNKNMKRSRKWFGSTRESSEMTDHLAYEAPVPEYLSDEEVLLGLQKIPAHYREAILLTDVEEFSYRESADILEIPIGTIMSRLSRGRKLLRMELAEVAKCYGIRNSKTCAPNRTLMSTPRREINLLKRTGT
ncbi:MAG: sigma-70 family RNA polymerase sigma factor [Pyrinomonadaceae bacterium]